MMSNFTNKKHILQVLKRQSWLQTLKRSLKQITPHQWAKRRRANLRHHKRLDFYKQFIGPGMLCFDIGANIGNRVKVFVELGASVVAVEPDPRCLIQLKRSYQKQKTVTIVPKGVAAVPGQLELFISSDIQTSSMSIEWINAVRPRLNHYTWEGKTTVDVTTLDHLIQQYGNPNFIKIDVEGFEVQVLQGLSQAIPVVSIEYTPELINNSLVCVDQLLKLGDYHFNYSIAETMELASPDWISGSEIKSSLGQLSQTNHSGDIYARLTSLIS